MGDFGLMFYNARWYDPTIGRFAQADSIIPQQQGVQAWDHYAYVNNVPTRYTDPSGHMCKDGDENIWGYCELPSPNKVKTFQNAYLNAVASKYDIKLAPGDRWEYAESIISGGNPVFGWTPSKPNDPYKDASGNEHTADDATVLITGDLLANCDSTLCAAGIMAHEATHSWIEEKIEAVGKERSTTDMNAGAAEEALADVVAMPLGDPEGFLMQHMNSTLNVYTDPRIPSQYLEDFYTIDLSNIASLVFGK